MSDERFTPGETVYVVLPPSPRNGRPDTLYLRAQVVSHLRRFVYVKLPGHRYGRNVLPAGLVRVVPAGARVQ